MVKVVDGDVLTAFDNNVVAIGHQVNCQGVMGAGLAKQIRSQYPAIYNQYKIACNKCQPLLGKIQPISVGNNKFIVNIFGQDRYGRSGTYTDYNALNKALIKMKDYFTGDLALPYGIGAGLAGGDWSRVSDIISSIFDSCEQTMYLYKL